MHLAIAKLNNIKNDILKGFSVPVCQPTWYTMLLATSKNSQKPICLSETHVYVCVEQQVSGKQR